MNSFSFDQLPRFERSQFIQDKIVLNEEDVCFAIDANICLVLNRLTRPEYNFSKRLPNATGVPNFTCHYLVKSLILVIEVKRKHVLENINGRTFPEFYQMDEKARTVI